MFPNNFQCSTVQRGWPVGIMYIRGLGWPILGVAVKRAGGTGVGTTAILFSGVIFYQHRQPSALTNPSTHSSPYVRLAIPHTPSRGPRSTLYGAPSKPPHLSTALLRRAPMHSQPPTQPPSHPAIHLPPSPRQRPISPPYRCSITFAMHFFLSSFFIKLDYNCIASSSCGIAGRKNGTLAGMAAQAGAPSLVQ